MKETISVSSRAHETGALLTVRGKDRAPSQRKVLMRALRLLPVLGLVLVMLVPAAPAAAIAGYLAPYPGGVGYSVTQPPRDLLGSICPDPNWSHCYNPDTQAWDFGMPNGSQVVASKAGQVIRFWLGNGPGYCDVSAANYANYIVVDHHDGTSAGYWHLQQSSSYVQPYDNVVTDQLLALSGNSGWVCPTGSGYHLHFFMQNTPPDGTVTNPSIYFGFTDMGRPGLYAWATSGNYGQ